MAIVVMVSGPLPVPAVVGSSFSFGGPPGAVSMHQGGTPALRSLLVMSAASRLAPTPPRPILGGPSGMSPNRRGRSHSFLGGLYPFFRLSSLSRASSLVTRSTLVPYGGPVVSSLAWRGRLCAGLGRNLSMLWPWGDPSNMFRIRKGLL